MHRIVDQLSDPADHLALDEALLLEADECAGEGDRGEGDRGEGDRGEGDRGEGDRGENDSVENDRGEAIRFWEFGHPVVVAGRSTRVDHEINRGFCDASGIPIYRRCSGGASVVGGRGCLMYSVVLGFDRDPALQRIDVAHQHVMTRVLRALRHQVADCEFQGTCDLTWRNRKCSGNSLRIARRHLLYHGTILYDADLSLIAACLGDAPRQPEYRRGRDHESFLTNVPIDPATFVSDLSAIFEVDGHRDPGLLQPRIRQLRRDRYDSDRWNLRH